AAGAAAVDDRVHADHHRARDPPAGARHAADAAEPSADRPRFVPDAVRDDAGDDPRVRRGGRALSRGRGVGAGRRAPRARPAQGLHARSGPRVRPRALRGARRRRRIRFAGRRAAVRPDPELHHERAQDRVPDRLPHLHPVPDHRSRRRERADVDGHDDAVADADLAAVQDHVVRARRRLVAAGRHARLELLRVRGAPMSPESVIAIGRQALMMTALLAAPLLLSALAAGLLIGMFQAATQINEMTLSFIPKLLVLAAALWLGGGWMLRVIVGFTESLLLDIPLLIG